MAWIWLCAIGILIVFALRGVQVGLIRSVCGVLAVLTAMAVASRGATLLSPAAAQALTPPLESLIEQYLSSALADTNAELAMQGLSGDALALTQELRTVLQAMGLYDSVLEILDDALAGSISAVIPAIAQILAAQLASYLAYGLVYCCIFSLIMILGRIIGSIMNLASYVPGIHWLNRVGGFVFGACKGCAFLLAIWYLLFQLQLVSGGAGLEIVSGLL